MYSGNIFLGQFILGMNMPLALNCISCHHVANLIIDGQYNKVGISPPEYLGEHFEFIKSYLEDRGVIYNVTTS